MTASEAYGINCGVWSDIQDHLPLLHHSARGNVLEIGVRGGASTSALLSGVEKHGGHLWSVDINNCRIFDHPQWTFIQANSIKEKERILSAIPDDLEVLFVDGDHSYEGCLSDLLAFGPRAKTIFVHDCECPDTFPGVRQAFDEFASKWGKGSTVISGSYGMGVINMCRIERARKINGWMTDEELVWLAREAGTHECIMEVGSYQGRSTRALGDNTAGTVYAVDDWKGLRTIDRDWWAKQTPESERENLYEIFSANIVDLMQSGKVIAIRCNHADTDKLHLPIPDMVFIDGSHDYESVKRDIETWLPRLVKGGLLCGHDFNQGPIQDAVKELLPGARDAAGLIWAWEKP